MDDVKALTALNDQFIDAFRRGSWDVLAPILAPSFTYLDGATGEVWSRERYVTNLEGHPLPTIAFDQLVVHVDGDLAVVSARTSVTPGRYSRFVDTYHRRPEGWRCVHACVWPLA
jgi:ketosteroid isomerase-like protein